MQYLSRFKTTTESANRQVVGKLKKIISNQVSDHGILRVPLFRHTYHINQSFQERFQNQGAYHVGVVLLLALS